MAVIHHGEKWVFLCEPHTASRMTQELLLKQYPGTEAIHPHHRPPKRIRGDFVMDGFTWIAAVRNPFDSLITKFLRPSMRKYTLDEYMATHWHHRDFEPSYEYCLECDRIIWFEHLKDDINRIFGRSFEFFHNEVHKTQDKKPWYTYFTPEQYQKLRDRENWGLYLKWFGYDVSLDGTVNIDQFRREELTRPL